MYISLIFFFKQKTAYEMRISDWSSDVCSSDLYGKAKHLFTILFGNAFDNTVKTRLVECFQSALRGFLKQGPLQIAAGVLGGKPRRRLLYQPGFGQGRPQIHELYRSEEHTSELQSLMRISYAVFCLKKKKTTK